MDLLCKVLKHINGKNGGGNECFLVGIKEGEQIVAATFLFSIPVAKVFKYFYAPRGFLIDYSQKEILRFFIEELTKFLKSKKGLYLKFDPYVLYAQRDAQANRVEGGFNHQYVLDHLKQLGCYHGGFTVGVNGISQARWMMTMDIQNKSEKDILKNMRTLTRRSIKKTEKLGIQVRELDIDEMDLFMDMLESTGKRCNFAVRERSFYVEQAKAFKNHCKVLVAYMDVDAYLAKIDEDKQMSSKKLEDILKRLEQDSTNEKNLNKKIANEKAIEVAKKKREEALLLKEKYGSKINMASGYFINQGQECVYISGASYEEFMKYDAQYAIQWYMIQDSIQNHLKRYNFYGQTGDFSETSEDYGVYEFKKGFGGIVEELVGDFVLPIRKNWFRLYNSIKHIV